jgi:hypothetical protein
MDPKLQRQRTLGLVIIVLLVLIVVVLRRLWSVR